MTAHEQALEDLRQAMSHATVRVYERETTNEGNES